MDSPDDAVERIARAMADEDGCCRLIDMNGRCCMTAKARKVATAVMHEIGKCGWDTGRPIGVLDEFAARTGIVFDRAKLLAEEAR